MAGKRKLTDEQKIEIVEKYKEGKRSCGSLGREYKVSHTAILNILKRRGVKINRHPKYVNKKYSCDENYFNKIDSEEKAYFLGLLYADGCVLKNLYGFSISLIESDVSILERFNDAISNTGPLKFINVKKNKPTCNNHYLLHITNERLAKRLNELGCVPKKSLILEFPTEEQVPNHLLQHFIRGYYDGDGCFSTYNRKNTNTLNFEVSIISTEKFCQTLIEKLSFLEINWEITIRDKTKSTRYLRNRGYNKVYKFLNWLYQDATVYLDRKYKKYLKHMNSSCSTT